MNNKKSVYIVIAIIFICSITNSYVDIFLSPPYFIKSILKVFIFLIFPLLINKIDKSLNFKSLFNINKNGIKFSFILGICIYLIILFAYLTLGRFFDLTNITKILNSTLNITKHNFIYVSIYICFINSLLEEFLFRGVAFLSLKSLLNKRFAYIFSSFSFSIYHVSMILNWFNPILFFIVLFSLFIAGIIFNFLNDKYENIYCSWIVHMFANFAINTIGFILFGII